MSQIGVQLTDSAYAVVNMRIMTRIGAPVFAEIDKGEKRVVPCGTHSVGALPAPGQQDVPRPATTPTYRPLSPETPRDLVLRQRATAATPLPYKKCFALRIASNIACDEGWMADEHMPVLGVESPADEKFR